MAKIRSQGTTMHISIEDAATTAYGSATMVKVNGLKSISDPDGEAAEIDTTDLDSTAKEFLMGIPDNGKITIAGDAVAGDPGQAQMLAARDAQQLRWVDIIDVLGNKVVYKAVVLRASAMGAEVNGVKPFNATQRVSGAFTYA